MRELGFLFGLFPVLIAASLAVNTHGNGVYGNMSFLIFSLPVFYMIYDLYKVTDDLIDTFRKALAVSLMSTAFVQCLNAFPGLVGNFAASATVSLVLLFIYCYVLSSQFEDLCSREKTIQ